MSCLVSSWRSTQYKDAILLSSNPLEIIVDLIPVLSNTVAILSSNCSCSCKRKQRFNGNHTRDTPQYQIVLGLNCEWCCSGPFLWSFLWYPALSARLRDPRLLFFSLALLSAFTSVFARSHLSDTDRNS